MDGTKEFPYTEKKFSKLLEEDKIAEPLGVFIIVKGELCTVIGVINGFYDIIPVNCTNCKFYTKLNFINGVCYNSEAPMYEKTRKSISYETIKCHLYELFKLEY